MAYIIHRFMDLYVLMQINPFSTGIVYRRQIMTSEEV